MARRLQLPILGYSTTVGLLATLMYAPFDILGAKFLWWTWHDTDVAIATRLFGVPVGSTMWVMTYTATFAWLVRVVFAPTNNVMLLSALVRGIIVASLSTPLMLVQMVAAQALEQPGKPGFVSLALLASVYWLCSAVALVRYTRSVRSTDRSPVVLRVSLTIYFIVLLVIAYNASPASVVSTGLHQPTGPCYQEAFDLNGNRRYTYLCVDDFHEDYSLDCAAGVAKPGKNALVEWYTICGTPHVNKDTFVYAVAALCIVGATINGLLIPTRDLLAPRTTNKSAAKKVQ
jgi:hypothetical protein